MDETKPDPLEPYYIDSGSGSPARDPDQRRWKFRQCIKPAAIFTGIFIVAIIIYFLFPSGSGNKIIGQVFE